MSYKGVTETDRFVLRKKDETDQIIDIDDKYSNNKEYCLHEIPIFIKKILKEYPDLTEEDIVIMRIIYKEEYLDDIKGLLFYEKQLKKGM